MSKDDLLLYNIFLPSSSFIQDKNNKIEAVNKLLPL